QLVVVSRDLTQAVATSAIAPTMQLALENWRECEQPLRELYDALNAGEAADSFAFDPRNAMAPLPRSYQFIDGSAFLNHGELMIKAYNLPDKTDSETPILIQRQGDDFRGPHDDYAFPTEADGGDFEGEFAVILDDVPMGVDQRSALDHIKLLTIFNDVSMRGHLLREKQMGFGFIQAKPATVFAPVAVTPDELGDDWRDGRVHLDMHVTRNGEWFGNPNGREMDFSFPQLISHLAYNRNLGAGTIIGSGTVSNRNYEQVGCACLAERRAIETVAHGEPQTPFLKFGETLRFEAKNTAGESIFGAIEHRLVPTAGKAS
ncbi:MAG: fumarylacetoacetate hydrolase family protein, partial [Spongiibacteraceae bacterium]|nr:fumarylacetoacetate hydrolase family protein [Spongiibacteraceae bacterium]